ncbi:hypothetical protein [Mesobacillus stamsii]|uniref:Uncharacterized protein n=1 Tax=Mesobacillus stamsii TaxID=225347 RepID=A0ABU0FS81_9BACI|nr:hypothetical protein [Mesobacillus stamsii]MDQ0412680.1 hypothetical protein [Mesobacillus stamsii]
MFKINDIDFEPVLKEVREIMDPLYVKHECLHEMLQEFYGKKDFESDTVNYLLRKIDELNGRMDILRDVRDYLTNMVAGVPFYVDTRVGMYMARFGLTEEQAQLLVDVYKEHRRSMGSEDRKKYLLAAAHKVRWVQEENCLHVHFGDTWWHYSADGWW